MGIPSKLERSSTRRKDLDYMGKVGLPNRVVKETLFEDFDG